MHRLTVTSFDIRTRDSECVCLTTINTHHTRRADSFAYIHERTCGVGSETDHDKSHLDHDTPWLLKPILIYIHQQHFFIY